jgi:hypothetical protein
MVMRKLLITLLLASAVATPALARPNDDDNDRHPNRAERQVQPRSEPRSERAVQPERPQPTGGNHFNQSNNGGGNGGGQPAVVPRQHIEPNGDGGHRDVQALRPSNGDAPESVRNWRGPRRERVTDQDQPNEQAVQDRRDRRERVDNDALRRSDRPLPPVMRTRVPVISNVPREGTQPPLRVDSRWRDNNVRWNTDWRRDNRYDWQRWRDRHHNWFHLGIYYDPFGWGYQPYSIGWRLWPSYYSSSFWINDPWQYRLPYAPPGYRWVRYWDDAILVDEWTGEVVDVIYNFFW